MEIADPLPLCEIAHVGAVAKNGIAARTRFEPFFDFEHYFSWNLDLPESGLFKSEGGFRPAIYSNFGPKPRRCGDVVLGLRLRERRNLQFKDGPTSSLPYTKFAPHTRRE